MSEDDLLADLSAIDARREKLRAEIERLRSTPQFAKHSPIPDSGVDMGYKSNRNPDDSFEIKFKTPKNTGYAPGHFEYPTPGYTLYEDEKDRTLPKVTDTENRLPRLGTISQPVFTETYLTPNPYLSTRCAVSSSDSSTVTWSNNWNPVQESVYRSLPTITTTKNISNERSQDYVKQ